MYRQDENRYIRMFAAQVFNNFESAEGTKGNFYYYNVRLTFFDSRPDVSYVPGLTTQFKVMFLAD